MKLGMVPTNIRQNNQLNVIRILKKKPYTHKQLAEKLKLSNTAIQNIVSSLQKKNLITVEKHLINKTGRPSALVTLNTNSFYTIKVVFGNTCDLNVSAYDFSKKLLLKKESSYIKFDTDNINETIARLTNEIIADNSLKDKTLCNIVVAVPGIVNNDNLVVTTSLNNNTAPYDPYSYLSKFFSCDIIITDDKINYAQGELTNNKDLKESNVILFFHMPAPSISLAINKTIYRGANGFFGEIGFVPEHLVTAQKINFREQNQTNIDHALSLIEVINEINKELSTQDNKISSISDISNLLEKKHPLVTEKISKHCDHLCSFILNLSIIFDFDTLVFPGEFAPLKKYYFEKLQQTLLEYAFSPIKLLLGNSYIDSSNNGILDMAIEHGLYSIINPN